MGRLDLPDKYRDEDTAAPRPSPASLAIKIDFPSEEDRAEVLADIRRELAGEHPWLPGGLLSNATGIYVEALEGRYPL